MAEETKKPDYPALVSLWKGRIDASWATSERWRKRGRAIQRIYRAQSTDVNPTSSENSAKFNIFWSNIETLGPATYSRKPKVEVFRRFQDEDPVGRVASMILERALQYEVDCKDDFHTTMKAVVRDRNLPGLGQAWVRYVPTLGEKTLPLPTPEGSVAPQPYEAVLDAFTPVDYVYWEDFRVGAGRSWKDIPWVARFTTFTKERLEERFGETISKFGGKISEIPLEYDTSKHQYEDQARNGVSDPEAKLAAVYEIWDKDQKRVIWIAEGYDKPLDIREDPYKVEDFWPCPMPLLASITSDQFLPTADYIYYQEQIRELDVVTRRIGILTGALRLVGAYDKTQEALKTLLSGGLENKMIPVDQWAAFAEKGGIKGVMDFLPLDQVVKTLQHLYEAREQLKQNVYEITGLSDIVRGATKASESLGAQQIKAKFANLRLTARQQGAAEFATRVLRLKAELMCKHYPEDVLIRISSADQIPDIRQDLANLQASQAAQPQPQMSPNGQPMPVPQQPPPSVEQSPLLQQALKLLKTENLRKYRIEVASDSMIELDEVEERERRNEFMGTLANFFNGVKNISGLAPEFMSVAMEMLKFAVRGFRVGRTLEAVIEKAVADMQKRMANPQPPPPSEDYKIAEMKEKGETERNALGRANPPGSRRR